MRYFKIILVLAVVIAVSGAIFLLRDNRREAVFYPMGGIPFKVVAYDRTPREFEADMIAVTERVEGIEQALNRFRDGSELALLNRDGTATPVKVGADMVRVLANSAKWNAMSDGAFDPTVTPLIELWKEAGKGGVVPSASMIEDGVRSVGFDEVVFVHDGRVLFAKEGMSLDFGAIAKGFMVDEVARLLEERGVERGVVDAGGNALAFGDGTFTFGIADPRIQGRGELLGTVKLTDGAVITSGNYERYTTIDGKRYSHIIDPRNGMPIESGLEAVTVIGGAGTDADALATALMVLGREEGMELVSRVPGVKVIFVEHKEDGWSIWAPASLKSDLRLTDTWVEKVKWY